MQLSLSWMQVQVVESHPGYWLSCYSNLYFTNNYDEPAVELLSVLLFFSSGAPTLWISPVALWIRCSFSACIFISTWSRSYWPSLSFQSAVNDMGPCVTLFSAAQSVCIRLDDTCYYTRTSDTLLPASSVFLHITVLLRFELLTVTWFSPFSLVIFQAVLFFSIMLINPGPH